MARAKPITRHQRLSHAGPTQLRLAVVADTHSLPHQGGLEHLAALKPDAILHAGDIGDLKVLARLEAVAPLYAVRGNIDGRDDGLADTLTLDVDAPGGTFRVLLTHIAVAGPRLRGDAARAAHAAKASLVVCGHSHVPFIGVDKGLTVFNPGSIGPRRFHLPIVFGVIEASAKGVTMRHVDAETGKDWSP
jgi:putative phosphoesterase